MTLFLLFTAVASLIISATLTGVIKQAALRFGVVDEPGERRSHTRPTPRGGGVAIVITFFVFMFVALVYQMDITPEILGLIISGLGITLLGLADDIMTLSRNFRLAFWVLITAIAVFFGISLNQINLPLIGVIEFGIFSPVITFLWLIGVTNFFNFMDGIDGLAAGEAISAGGFLMVVSLRVGNEMVLFSSVIILGGALGFMIHNFPPAKVFMGDGGSNFLGFIFAALAVLGGKAESGQIPFVVPVILLNMFLLDGSVTLIKRLPKGKDWLEPHRDHYYQRLIKLGLSHLQVTLMYSSMNVILGGVAYFYLIAADELLRAGLLVLSAVPFLFVVIITHRRELRVSTN
jgi:UDP-GlcNAc:undecaprenyl-phosphate GlcNAc-1-phosphate transferase